MSDETRMEEMNTEVTTPVDDYSTETSKGSSMVAKAVIVGVCGAVAGAAAFGAKKLKERNEKKTIERLRKKGWKVEEPAVEDVENINDSEIVSEEELVPEEIEQ